MSAIRKKITVCIALAALLCAGCWEQIDPREPPYNWPAPDPDSPLISTKWRWDSGWENAVLHFGTAQTVWYNEDAYDYFFDKAIRRGEIVHIGIFTITGNYDTMDFSQWKSYPHGAHFIRNHEQP